MPANTFGDSPMDWYRALPPVTRTHVTICVLTTLAFAVQLLNPYTLMLEWTFIRKLQVLHGRTRLAFLSEISVTTKWPVVDEGSAVCSCGG